MPIHQNPTRRQPRLTRTQRIALLSALLVTSGSFLHGAAASTSSHTGVIYGRVQNITSELFIKNAQVSVEGTDIVVTTNETGDFSLSNIPVGPVTLKVVYPGLDTQFVKLEVAEGKPVEQIVRLTRGNIKATGMKDDVIIMDPVVVSDQKDTNAAAIASNEQRFAANLKTVVSADSFGDIPEGNVGEFLKFLPGVGVENNATEVRNITLRGFDPEFSGVAIDGNRAASPSSGNDIRAFDLRAVSLNNISRAEVTKVPLPDMPADSLGGSVNLVTKSAFEHAKAQASFSAGLSFNSEDLSGAFKRTSGPAASSTFKTLPTATFSYINPINKRLGITVSGLWNNQFNENHRPVYNWRLTGGSATPTAPYLQSYQYQDGPSIVHRASLSIKADYKIARGHIISLGFSESYYHFFFGNRNITYTTGTSTISTTNPTPFSSDYTLGDTAKGAVAYSGSWRNMTGVTGIGTLRYQYDIQGWKGEVGGSYSRSNSYYRDTSDGYFQTYSTKLVDSTLGAPTVALYNLGALPNSPRVVIKDKTNTTVVDHTNLANYQLTSVTSAPVDGSVKYSSGNANVRRDFYLGRIPTTVKVGYDIRSEERDNRRQTKTWNYVGADRKSGTADDNMAAFADTHYREDAGYGNGHMQWVSPIKMYDLYKTDPSAFVYQEVASETNRIKGSTYLRETIPAAYIRGDLKLFGSRLLLAGGVRYEATQVHGECYTYDPDAPYRDANGKIVRDSAGKRVRQSTTVAGSMDELRLMYKERGNKTSRSYDGYYPSISATVNLNEQTLLRAAFAETIGRPSPTYILPTLTIDEADTLGGTNTITMNNPGLKPQFARNYDLSLERYFPKGGKVSVGVFVKDVYDFRTSISTTLTSELAEQLELPSSYADGTWQVSTQGNAGHARIRGVEAVYETPLKFIPSSFGRMSIQTNGTVFGIGGADAAAWPKFIRQMGNVVLRWGKGPISADVKVNYRGLRRDSSQFGTLANLYQYTAAKGTIDFNVNYRLSKRLSLYMNARNITNRADQTYVMRDDTPGYARARQTQSYGVSMYMGLKGSF